MRFVDGLVDGPIVSYWESGAKQWEGAYRRGKRVGKWTEYSEDGRTQRAEAHPE